MTAPIRPSIAAPVMLGLIAARAALSAPDPALLNNPRVQVFPSANGTVLLSGVTIDGHWVAEYRCLAEDFDEACVLRMEQRVLKKEHRRPHLMR